MEEKAGNSRAVATTGANPFQVYADAVAPRTIVGKLLKFAKGDFISGEAGEVVPENTEFTVLMDEALCGWTKWESGKPTEHQMGRIADNFVPPRRSDLGDIDKAAWEEDADGRARDPWQFCNYVVMKREPDGNSTRSLLPPEAALMPLATCVGNTPATRKNIPISIQS